MNDHIEKLFAIAKKDSRMIIGLMSGTSLDGLDVALCRITGSGIDTTTSLLKFVTVKYDQQYKDELKTIFARKNIELEKLCLINEWIGSTYAAIVNNCLADWNIKNEMIDLIASHGQTVFHAPKHAHSYPNFNNGTLQIGDGDHIAVNAGIITISDFRQKHIAAGGEGAPLAAYGDFILFSEKENDVIMVNIGGISNFTYIPAGASFDQIICSDIGPGNTMMDTYIQSCMPGKGFDENASMAKKGTVYEPLLKSLKQHDFFDLPFPKTTGPELFNLNYLQDALQHCGNISLYGQDVMATLNYFTASNIAESLIKVAGKQNHISVFFSGGGIHNPLLMDTIKALVPEYSVNSTSAKNIDPDAKEAILFALLANEAVAGNGYNFGKGSTSFPAVSMGKISFPG